MDLAITTMSSKGQIVIPAGMRSHIKAGEKLVIIQNEDQLIMKRATDVEKNLKEDLAFARRTEEAWERYQKGEFKSMKADKFLLALEKW